MQKVVHVTDDGWRETVSVSRGTDGKPAWTIDARPNNPLGWLDSEQSAFPGGVELDADGKGVIVNGNYATIHARADGPGKWSQTPEQVKAWEAAKTEYNARMAQYPTEGMRGGGGLGAAGAAGIALPMIMGH